MVRHEVVAVARKLYAQDDMSSFNGTANVSLGATLSNTGVVAATDETIAGIDLSSLADGTVTLTVYLTDVAGNQFFDSESLFGLDPYRACHWHICK